MGAETQTDTSTPMGHVTDHQHSVYCLVTYDGYGIRQLAKEWGVYPNAVHKAYSAAKKVYELGCTPSSVVPRREVRYNPLDMAQTISEGTVLIRTSESAPSELTFTDVGWQNVHWISATYDLHDWRIDSAMECEICHEPLERYQDGRWCKFCGKWAYGYNVGVEDSYTVAEEW